MLKTPLTSFATLVAVGVTALGVTPAASAGPGTSDPWVYGWGNNVSGQLGNGSTSNANTPGQVIGVARQDVKSVRTGGWTTNDTSYTVALLKNGTLKSWGNNTYGQLGNGSTTAQRVPGAVVGLTGVRAMDVGCYHGVALRNGRVWTWGRNNDGQLGNGVPFPAAGELSSATTPVEVQSLDDVKAVAAGCTFTMALRQDGTVWTWGTNVHGQLGNGTNTRANTPQQVQGLSDVEAIDAGGWHALAVTKDHKVMSWGNNAEGELGVDNTTNSNKPVEVKHLASVARIFAGPYNTFALLADGTVKAWGYNNKGQLGDTTTTNRTTPHPVAALTGVREISPGHQHTLAVLEDQSVIAWGGNDQGQLGNGTTTDSPVPVTVLPADSGVVHVAGGQFTSVSFAY
ncbi:chromosome condensation regulator RCC1 [Streptomyces sp. NBC_01764]|uniref:RCC1 domain-containing protein n=1 Tax=Streptomyces sp. NBC_01764 TaxID=2975935 RepID=UPI00224DD0CB|nr:chromosome condensation regulator RCC1 [Streptomyces sp. NBC_01764]MCX4403976.1 chromosome condensation regulator RCC1 [Streptomyces sp. NBC_01764]